MGNCNQAPEDAGVKLELQSPKPDQSEELPNIESEESPPFEDLLPYEGNLLRYRPEVKQKFIERCLLYTSDAADE